MPSNTLTTDTRRFLLERVGDVAIAQVYADGFESLSLREKTLIWHLYLAAIAGRDIYYDQRYAFGLEMRTVLEAILRHGDHLPAAILEEVRHYAKLFWVNNGPFNNVTARKFVLKLSPAELIGAVEHAARAGAALPLAAGETPAQLAERLAARFLDPAVDPIVTNKTPEPGGDMLAGSANNLYEGVHSRDLEGFRERYGLNSRLIKRDGQLEEEVYRVGGRYDAEIRRIIAHLEDAIPFAPRQTADALRALIRFYRTGEPEDRMAYDIAWVQDREGTVDTINGFVEVYLDPRGTKGAWEGLVCYVNGEKTRQIQALAANAQWFEDHMPWEPRYRKPTVVGVTARAIDILVETGDSGPMTPVGINLPNDQTVRERYGSKSVSLSNISEASERSSPPTMRTEFSWSAAEAERAATWAAFTIDLTTEMHEVIGHGSGRMADGITAAPHELLKEYYSAVEEARSDLVALYFLPDPKLVELQLVNAEQQGEIVQAAYEYYARGALVQLRRIREGTQLEEDHMRNRQMVVNWLLAHTDAIDVRHRDGKTYFVMVDCEAFRAGVGALLAEVQRIKSEGDFAAARELFDCYGIHFDPALRDEVVARVDALQVPSYTAFVMPRLEAARDASGAVVDVTISYPCDFEAQMLEYAALART
jgi:dipeptidyl-peptidase-3